MRCLFVSIAFLTIAVLTPLPSRAANAPGAPASPSPAFPVLSHDTSWVRPILITIAIVFVVAALLGPLIRMSAPDDELPTHSHDEPPGSSHHHGPTGTIDLAAPERHH